MALILAFAPRKQKRLNQLTQEQRAKILRDFEWLAARHPNVAELILEFPDGERESISAD